MAMVNHATIKKHQSNNDGADDTTVNAGFSGPKSGQWKKPFKGNKEGSSSLDKILERPYQIHGTPDNLLTTPIKIAGFLNRTVS